MDGATAPLSAHAAKSTSESASNEGFSCLTVLSSNVEGKSGRRREAKCKISGANTHVLGPKRNISDQISGHFSERFLRITHDLLDERGKHAICTEILIGDMTGRTAVHRIVTIKPGELCECLLRR